ncbi:Phytoene synthase [Granulibacter bethesdensis]|uniref:presqualene diphosphate synthase HpnD n=1 Tax=Granulibacter bethesdensis TaxID=364410 RepID=UPI00090A631D|nr:presqualene diphosphate synthase HpnD [Granulibacter bethesdensis]APH57806.1 Phytoene synthase [Granulibacter bethesdensis]
MTALSADAADLARVEALTRASGTSFYQGMKVLPADRRLAMYAIYAFCRIVDDIADEPAPIEEKRVGLNKWRTRIAALYRGEADDPVTRVLLPAIRTFRLRQDDFLAVIDGMQTDAETQVVAPGWAELDLYCDQVASAVGRLSVRAFGDESEDADKVAHHLGRALQLTNILRDLQEDAARGRLYLPREWLVEAGVPLDARAAMVSPALEGVCRRVVQIARAHYADAFAFMAQCDQRAMRPARLMAATYRAILNRLEQAGWTPPRRVSLPAWEKLWVLLRHGLG